MITLHTSTTTAT